MILVRKQVYFQFTLLIDDTYHTPEATKPLRVTVSHMALWLILKPHDLKIRNYYVLNK